MFNRRFAGGLLVACVVVLLGAACATPVQPEAAFGAEAPGAAAGAAAGAQGARGADNQAAAALGEEEVVQAIAGVAPDGPAAPMGEGVPSSALSAEERSARMAGVNGGPTLSTEGLPPAAGPGPAKESMSGPAEARGVALDGVNGMPELEESELVPVGGPDLSGSGAWAEKAVDTAGQVLARLLEGLRAWWLGVRN